MILMLVGSGIIIFFVESMTVCREIKYSTSITVLSPITVIFVSTYSSKNCAIFTQHLNSLNADEISIKCAFETLLARSYIHQL
jgi:hypothetical protein